MQRLATVGLVLAGVSVPSAQTQAQESHAPAFEELKSLLDNCEGKIPDGSTTRATYRLTSEGSVLVETTMPSEPSEVTESGISGGCS